MLPINQNIPLYLGSDKIEGWTIELSDEEKLRQSCGENNDFELSVRNVTQDFLKKYGNKFTEKSLNKLRIDKSSLATIKIIIVSLFQ